jgi:hypothetical protein
MAGGQDGVVDSLRRRFIVHKEFPIEKSVPEEINESYISLIIRTSSRVETRISGAFATTRWFAVSFTSDLGPVNTSSSLYCVPFVDAYQRHNQEYVT